MPGRLFLFAHGAGAPSASHWMRAWARRLSALGSVVTFDYPYMLERKKRPDAQPKLIEAHRRALAEARQAQPDKSIVLAGKSMGSRIGCHVALEERVSALVCFGYPLKGAGARAALRDQVLVELDTPILFVQGSRDALCPLGLLEQVRARMRAPNELEIVEGGDHSLAVTRSRSAEANARQDEVDQKIFDAVSRFVERYAA